MDTASYRFTGMLKDVKVLVLPQYAYFKYAAAASKLFEEKMPNPLRKLASDSEELVSCFIKPWCDDVSGGQTKQYQPHNNIYVMHANLPGSFLNQEFSVRFASTATHASSTEQFEAIKEQLEENNKNPICVYNAATGRYVHLCIYILNIPGDNRAQSEVVSHAGQPRTTEDTVHKIWEQITIACLGVESHVASLQTNSGVKDATAQKIIIQLIERGCELKKQLKQPGQQVEDHVMVQEQSKWLQSQPALPFNVLFQIHGLDPHRDTPVEILHTILLGVEKYAWYLFHSSMKADAHKTFETRLQSANIMGLEMDPVQASYMVRFKNNLIGRHFKALMQLMVFQVHDLVSADLFSLIKAVGDLGAMLWYSEIMDLELYLVCDIRLYLSTSANWDFA
ncbi:hypothetical protein FRC10_003539 [Ceratobasidium sp. 414]|nr:hypothetical protein FRC10_003539 [Ceratobasidium sp. 414]